MKDPTEFRARFKAYKEGKSVKEIYDGGYIKEPVITPDPQYNEYINSLPDNQRLTPESSYRSHRYWELNGKPKNFSQAIQKGMFTMQPDGWHANSVAENTNTSELEFMKPWNHPTVKKEYDWFKSKEASNFRKHYKLAGTVPYDKYIPKYKDGKLPGYKDGIYDDNTYKKMIYGRKSIDDEEPQYQRFINEGVPEDVALSWTKSVVNNFPDSYYVEGPTLPEITVKPDPNSMSTALLTTYYPWSEEFPVTGHSTLELVHDSGEYSGFVTSYGTDPWYNFVTNNCSDATREAIESATGKKINPFFFTTPGDVKDFVENNLGGKSEYDRRGFSETTFNIPTKQARKIIEYAKKQSFIRVKNRHKNITE